MNRVLRFAAVIITAVVLIWATRHQTVQCFQRSRDDLVFECVVVSRWTGRAAVKYVPGSVKDLRAARAIVIESSRTVTEIGR